MLTWPVRFVKLGIIAQIWMNKKQGRKSMTEKILTGLDRRGEYVAGFEIEAETGEPGGNLTSWPAGCVGN